MKRSTTVVLTILFPAFVTAALAADPQPRIWESVDGKFKVEATLVDYSAEDVRLTRNGKTITVPREKISAEDNQHLRESPDNTYRVPGLFTINNPETGYGWHRHTMEYSFQEHMKVVGLTSIDEREVDRIVVMFVVEGPQNETDREVAVDIAQAGIRHLERNGLRIVERNDHQELEGGRLVAQTIELTLSVLDDAIIYGKLHSKFGKKWPYLVMAIATDPKRAESLASVINTIKELPRDSESESAADLATE